MQQMQQKQPRVYQDRDPVDDLDDRDEDWDGLFRSVQAVCVFWWGSQGYDPEDIADFFGWDEQVVKALDDDIASISIGVKFHKADKFIAED